MAAPRLPFLWPMLFRESPATIAQRTVRAAAYRRALHQTSRRRQQETVRERYGAANEPPPHLGGGKGFGPPSKQSAPNQAKALPKIGEKLQHDGEVEVKHDREDVAQAKSEDKAREPATTEAPQQSMMYDPMLDSAESRPSKDSPGAPDMPTEKPMASILNAVPDPVQHSKEEQDAQQQLHAEEHPDKWHDDHTPPVHAPHIETPKYVHHFDTYGLVKRLEEGGWTDLQAVTVMKATRLILADNMDLAKEALVSKSNVENETYLFRAACSELRTEVTARRKAEQEKMRTERTQLQHEVDILSQRMGQESGSLKDDLKGMFDDRKMTVRNEQRSMESKIQELNYKITVNLQADSKSEVEGLRWIMTRRVILTLGLVVAMVVGSLKLYSNALHEQEMEEKRRANMRSGGTQTEDYRSDAGNGSGGSRREAKTFGAGEMLVKDGDNPAFVSLG